MSIKKLIPNHGLDIIVALLLLSYILMDNDIPSIIHETGQSVTGLIVLIILTLLSFSYFHPIVGVLAIITIFKTIVNNRQVGAIKYPQYENMAPYSEATDTFASQMPSTNLPEEIRSNDDSLEEEIIASMAPLISSSNYMNSSENVNISPVMAPSGGSNIEIE